MLLLIADVAVSFPAGRVYIMVYSFSHMLETPLKSTLIGLAKLTRFDEHVFFVLITTFLGAAVGQATFGWRLLAVLGANLLAVSFAFMINDIEDAPEDAFSEKNYARNPVSSGLISPQLARAAAVGVVLLSIGLFALLGLQPLMFGLACLLLGWMYSVKSIRLKTMPYVELISHGLLLAGLPFLCGYFTFAARFNSTWFWPFTFVISARIIIVLYGELRNIEQDLLARIHPTVHLLGERAATNLMIAMVVLVASCGAVSFFFINLVPAWVLLFAASVAVLLMIPVIIKIRRGDPQVTAQGLFRKPLERAAALALVLHFLLPLLIRIF